MELELLLGTNELDILRLLTYLETHGGQTAKQDICRSLKISLKSLRSQIQHIQQRFDNDIICINQSRKVIILYRDHSSFLLFKKKLFQESPTHKILLTLLTERKLSYTKLQDSFFLSSSTVKRYTHKLKELLRTADLELKNLKITGPEDKIRAFYLTYIYETFSITENPFIYCQPVENYLNLIVKYVAEKDTTKISRFNTYRLQRILYISYFRSLISNDMSNTFEDCLSLPTTEHTTFFERVLHNKQFLPNSLVNEKEIQLLLHFLFNLPIIKYDGQFFTNFVQLQKETNSSVYQLYEFSREILTPVFRNVDTLGNLKKLELLLFSINLNGLFFSTNQDASEIIGNRINGAQTPYNLNAPSIEYLTAISQRINKFLADRSKLGLKTNYLVNNYGFLIIQSSLYSTQKIRIGLFLANGPLQMRIAFDYLKGSLQVHPILQFFNLLEEEEPCDYLITNDVIFLKENTNQFKDSLLLTLQNIALDTQKVNQWLLGILMEQFNSPYRQALKEQ